MSVVTAVRNFVRLYGGSLSLAIGSTLINNSLRTALSSLSLSRAAITTIINDPLILGPYASANQLTSLGLTQADAAYALAHGYTQGFRSVFILNASLAACATLVSVFMIKHKELIRGDEEKLKVEVRQEFEMDEQRVPPL